MIRKGIEMGRIKPVDVVATKFNSKSSALRYFKGVVHYNAHGDPITNEDTIYNLLGLLRLHHRYPEKVGAGIDYFYVDEAENFKTNCLWIKRLDGSSEDFSYVKIIESI